MCSYYSLTTLASNTAGVVSKPTPPSRLPEKVSIDLFRPKESGESSLGICNGTLVHNVWEIGIMNTSK